MTDHPYCYPGTLVYRNKLDIRDAAHPPSYRTRFFFEVGVKAEVQP